MVRSASRGRERGLVVGSALVKLPLELPLSQTAANGPLVGHTVSA